MKDYPYSFNLIWFLTMLKLEKLGGKSNMAIYWSSKYQDDEKMSVINFCIIYIKYYIYIQRLFKNNLLDVDACKVILKSVLMKV